MADSKLSGINSNTILNSNDASSIISDTIQEPPIKQPTVRHIPIYIEGRDTPVISNNQNLDTTYPIEIPIPIEQNSKFNHLPKEGGESILDKVRNIPVRKFVPKSFTRHIGNNREESPGRIIPIQVVHESTQKNMNTDLENKTENIDNCPKEVKIQQEENEPTAAPTPPQPPAPTTQQCVDPVTKIKKIQDEISELMDRVEKFQGGTKTDKEYIYLDEMLTQNLLKLDTIDAEGKGIIKAARKETIKCINACIAVLEAKIGNAPVKNEDNIKPEVTTQKLTNNIDQSISENCKEVQIKDEEKIIPDHEEDNLTTDTDD